MTSVQLRAITKKYDNAVEAVSNVDLDVAASEFLVLVGPSGCGKSTLLRMIAGLEAITSGELYFDGELMNETLPRQRDVGMVFQNYALYPHLSVADNLAFPLRVRKESKESINTRVHEVAAMLSIEHLLARLPKQLSGGQRQRVALGRAIARTPRVFLFDEPLSNLDANLRVEMRSELTLLQRKVGSTAIYVTHDHTEAMTMGDRIAVLRDGRIMQVGTPSELYNNPANEFVAGFLGTPKINFFRGQIIREDGLKFVEDNNGITLPLRDDSFIHSLPDLNAKASLALRAENIYPQDHAGLFAAEVQNIEFVGHETLIHFQTSDTVKIARLHSSTSLERGSVTNFAVDTAKVMLFDAGGVRM